MTSCTRVYVGNLLAGVSQVDLEREFGRFGKLKEVWIARNPPGFAFVEFFAYVDAERAISSLNGKHICGSKVTVEMSKNPIERGQKRRRGDRQERDQRFGRDRRIGDRDHRFGDRDRRIRGGRQHPARLLRNRPRPMRERRTSSRDNQKDLTSRRQRPTPPPLLPKAVTAKAQLARKLKRRARKLALRQKVAKKPILPMEGTKADDALLKKKEKKGGRKKKMVVKKPEKRYAGSAGSPCSASLSPLSKSNSPLQPRRGPRTPSPLDRSPIAVTSPRGRRTPIDLSPERPLRSDRQLLPYSWRSPSSSPPRPRRRSRSPEPHWDASNRYTSSPPPYGNAVGYPLSAWYQYAGSAIRGGNTYRKGQFPLQEGLRSRLPRNRSRSPVRGGRSPLPPPPGRYLRDLWDMRLPLPPLPPRSTLEAWERYKDGRAASPPRPYGGRLNRSRNDPLPPRLGSFRRSPSPRSFGGPQSRNYRSPPRGTYNRQLSPRLAPMDLPYHGYYREHSPPPRAGYPYRRAASRSPVQDPLQVGAGLDRNLLLRPPSPGLGNWPRTNSPYDQYARRQVSPSSMYKREGYSAESPRRNRNSPRQSFKGKSPPVSPLPKHRPRYDSPSPRQKKPNQYRSPSISPVRKKRYTSRSSSPRQKPWQYRTPSPDSPRGQGRLVPLTSKRDRGSPSLSPSSVRRMSKRHSPSPVWNKSRKRKSRSPSPKKYTSNKRRNMDSPKKKYRDQSVSSDSSSQGSGAWDSSPGRGGNARTAKGKGYAWSSDSADDWSSPQKNKSDSGARNSSIKHRVKSYEVQMKSGGSNYKVVKTMIHETKYHNSSPKMDKKKSVKKSRH